jgi:hypothetical protein
LRERSRYIAKSAIALPERVHYTADDLAGTFGPDGRRHFTHKDGRPW